MTEVWKVPVVDCVPVELETPAPFNRGSELLELKHIPLVTFEPPPKPVTLYVKIKLVEVAEEDTNEIPAASHGVTKLEAGGKPERPNSLLA